MVQSLFGLKNEKYYLLQTVTLSLVSMPLGPRRVQDIELPPFLGVSEAFGENMKIL